ncbi:cupredoxin family protein [Piscinibacter sp. XHJ-5]|uniref:cupredoxin domain-containing protein n=1 Tax=Piscinibacter sp. XHJ-5 TaxID=3037797 RepID=UPI002452A19D|nr:cupredoxin family protein [Piscinibacter sp. XHJ-5]
MNISSLLRGATLGAVVATSATQAHETSAHPASAPRRFDASKVEGTPFGRQGDPRKVSRTIRVAMSDDMRFTPSHIVVRRGETVRLVAANRGQVLHELVLGTEQALEEHAALMKKFPGMEHDEPHMTHVKPGGSGDIVWQFTRAGEFRFACLIPGHFEAGMVGTVSVK